MRLLKLALVLLSLNLLTSAFSCHNTMLKIHNGSKQKITVLYANSAIPSTPNNIDYYIADYVLINPDSTGNITIGGGKYAWHYYIKKVKDKHLYLYVFSVDTLKKYNGLYSMNQLSAMGKYLKALKYSEQELIKMNWLVNYTEDKTILSSK